MKKLLFTFFLLAGMVTFGFAQQGNGQQMSPEDRAKRQTEQLTTRLKLNDEQQAKVLAIQLDRVKKSMELRQNSSGDREAMRAEMQKLTQDSDAKMNALLTDEQKKAYEEFKAEQRERMQNRQGSGQ